MPASGGKKSAYTCADEAEHRRQNGLSFIAGADNRIARAVIIDGCTGSEAGTRADRRANEGVASAMPRAARGYLLHAVAGNSLLPTFGPDNNGIVGTGLKLAFDGLVAVDYDPNLLAWGELFQIVPSWIVRGIERATDEQTEKQQNHSETKCAQGDLLF